MNTLKLDQNVSQLTRDQKIRVERDDGESKPWYEYVEVPALLDQLREAVTPGAEAGSKGSGVPAPVAVNALDLLNDITATATEYWSLFTQTHTVHGSLDDRIRSWAANVRGHREDAIQTAEWITGEWVQRINDLFDPPKMQQVKGNCPDCGARYTYTQQDGETVRTPALQVTVREGGQSYAECGDCGAYWSRGQMHLLAEVVAA